MSDERIRAEQIMRKHFAGHDNLEEAVTELKYAYGTI